jgi:hypothetical protein
VMNVMPLPILSCGWDLVAVVAMKVSLYFLILQCEFKKTNRICSNY